MTEEDYKTRMSRLAIVMGDGTYVMPRESGMAPFVIDKNQIEYWSQVGFETRDGKEYDPLSRWLPDIHTRMKIANVVCTECLHGR